MNISCGLATEPASPIEHQQDQQSALSSQIQLEPLTKTVTIGPLEPNQHCWVLNQYRWLACHHVTNAHAEPLTLACMSGDTIILSDREDFLHLKTGNSSPNQALPAIRAAANERIGSSVLLEVR
jgi:hypothetical protein